MSCAAIVPPFNMASRVFSQTLIALLLVLFWLPGSALANVEYVTATVDNQFVLVKDNRQPALYTGSYGDCMGNSSINVTRFDAAYYKDNMTVLFHLEGDTALRNESIMSMHSLLGCSRALLTFDT
jgi:hypothetical protein